MRQLIFLVLALIPLQTFAVEYRQARQQAIQARKPLVVLLGAEWCPACKEAWVPAQRIGRIGIYTYLDVDKSPEIARQVGTDTVPKVVIYYPIGEKWTVRTIVGLAEIVKHAAIVK